MSNLFEGVNKGDKVRVEWPAGAMEGVYDGRETVIINKGIIEGLSPAASIDRGSVWWQFGNNDNPSVTVIRKALPVEPPVGSVVLVTRAFGKRTEPYVRFMASIGHSWCSTRQGTASVSWEHLHNIYETVTVLWTPEVNQ